MTSSKRPKTANFMVQDFSRTALKQVSFNFSELLIARFFKKINDAIMKNLAVSAKIRNFAASL
ncbi:MAG: hypothetical protein K2O24_06345 [Muribaculaceae bacterium]|nr:hypothetical protein [Muribaculaceae bacterium]